MTEQKWNQEIPTPPFIALNYWHKVKKKRTKKKLQYMMFASLLKFHMYVAW
jgi:hypothetical protein